MTVIVLGVQCVCASRWEAQLRGIPASSSSLRLLACKHWVSCLLEAIRTGPVPCLGVAHSAEAEPCTYSSVLDLFWVCVGLCPRGGTWHVAEAGPAAGECVAAQPARPALQRDPAPLPARRCSARS